MIMDFLLDRFTKENFPRINMDICLSKIYGNKTRCRECIDICHNDAIAWSKGRLKIDENLCTKCGLCKSACPTYAIRIYEFGEEDVLRSIESKQNIIFSCSKASQSGNLIFNCLNGIHLEFLIYLFIEYNDRTLYFNISACDSCKAYSHESILLDRIDRALDFIKALGIQANYQVLKDIEEVKDISNSETISRRDLFKIFGKESSKLASKAMETMVRDDNEHLGVRNILVDTIHRNREKFNSQDLETSTLIASWEIDNKCNGCEKCKSACPTKSWKFEREDGKLNIYHKSGSCINCGRCKGLCPKGAIFESKVLIEAIKSYDLKKSLDLFTCISCGKDFIGKDGENNCVICNKRQALRTKIANSK